ncbi:SpoIIE family protein phosphatase [Streptomyces liangshanensis]|uniref:protein-serine/threonine phosphatase n=1 Tax=Streptomyces liangshanensis TaxID=2717324 RepID=A0A6G9GSE8_9ACTN|nr:SpoIIE family protein phosphatase [Streptomyces liangshanensis]
MADQGARPGAVSPPDDWPADPAVGLALNRMGGFDWDLVGGALHLDGPALEVFDLREDEFDGRGESLLSRIPPEEAERVDRVVRRAVETGTDRYALYFRIRCRDGSKRWTHSQARIRRDERGEAVRVIGIVRIANRDRADAAARSELDEGRRRLTDMVERTTALLSTAETVQDVIEVLEDEEALGHLRAESVSLGVVEGTRIRLVAQGRNGPFAPELQYTRIDERFPMGEAVRTERPRFVTSREEFRTAYPRLWPHIEPLVVSSGAYLPLIAQSRPIGVLAMLYPRHGDFSDSERALLVALGSSIAQSLQRAMLYDQEHDLADGLQQAMLPRRIPDIPGALTAVRYRPARIGRSVGGDWYDVLPLPGGRVGLTIGDVQGHDTEAAVVMGQLRMVLWAYAAEGHPPATAMARAAAFLHELDTDRFATCTYVEVDLATGGLQIVRAGHLDPMVRGTDGTCAWITTTGGLPLGLAAEFAGDGGIDYPVTTGTLGPGDTLVLCTDGLVEEPGTDLGERMNVLAEAVRTGPEELPDLADMLFDRLGTQGGGDDMALLLLRRDVRDGRSRRAARPRRTR